MDEIVNPLKGKTEYGWHFEQQVYDPDGITRTVKANGGSGNIPKVILEENKRNEDETLTNTQTNIFEFLGEEGTVEKKDFTFVELFAGIGGVSFGLEQVGGRCLLAAEWDPVQEGKTQFAQESYRVIHPDTPITGNVMDMNKDNTPDHDVLTATFPCQSFSVAGKRGGFEDARGTLFFEAARIANEKKPKVILAENVKGLVGHDKGKTLDTIVKALNEIGYRVDFEVLNSKYFGVPQNRERIFIVAVREDLVDNAPWNIVGNTVVPKGKRRISGYEDVKTFNFDWPTNNTVELRLKDVLESEVDEKYYLSEEKTAQLIADIDKVSRVSDEINQIGNIDQFKRERNNPQTGRVYGENGVSPALSTMQGGGLEPKVAETYDSPKKIAGLWGASQAGSMWDTNGMSPTIKTSSGGYSEPIVSEPQLEVIGSTSETSDHSSHNVYDKEGLSPTLLSRDYKDPKKTLVESAEGAADLTRNGQKEIESNGEEYANALTSVQHDSLAVEKPHYRIRKLTPLECWRLQGFTDEQHNAVEAAGISNSQRYKQAGNAVTVNVIKALGERLLPYL